MAVSSPNLSYPMDLHKSVLEVDESETEISDTGSSDASDFDEKLINAKKPKLMNSQRSGKIVFLERCKNQHPDEYGYMIGLCKLGLVHYENIHDPDREVDIYEFERLDKAFNEGVEYSLTFSAESSLTDKVESFEAVGRVISTDDEINLEIVSCHLLK